MPSKPLPSIHSFSPEDASTTLTIHIENATKENKKSLLIPYLRVYNLFKNLVSLKISCSLKEESTPNSTLFALGRAIHKTASLRTLILDNCLIAANFPYLDCVLAPHLESLTIQNQFTKWDDPKHHIPNFIAKTTKLITFSFINNITFQAWSSALIHALRVNRSIKTLNLIRCLNYTHAGEQLKSTLMSNTHIKTVNIAFNELHAGINGGEILQILSADHLNSIRIMECYRMANIVDELKLEEQFKFGATLTELVLHRVAFAPGVTTTLMKALADTSTITTFKMRGSIRAEEASEVRTALFSSLIVNQSITFLDLRDQNLEDAPLGRDQNQNRIETTPYSMLNVLRHNRTLETVLFKPAFWSYGSHHILTEVLYHNPSITHMDPASFKTESSSVRRNKHNKLLRGQSLFQLLSIYVGL